MLFSQCFDIKGCKIIPFRKLLFLWSGTFYVFKRILSGFCPDVWLTKQKVTYFLFLFSVRFNIFKSDILIFHNKIVSLLFNNRVKVFHVKTKQFRGKIITASFFTKWKPTFTCYLLIILNQSDDYFVIICVNALHLFVLFYYV